MLTKRYLPRMIAFLLLATNLPQVLYAAQVTPKDQTTIFSNQDMLRYALAGIMLLLLVVIAVLGSAVANAGKLYRENEKKNSNALLKTLLLVTVGGMTNTARAGEIAEQAVQKSSWMPADISVMLLFLVLEFLIIFVLAYLLQQFLNTKTEKAQRQKRLQWKVLFQKVNQTVSLEEEYALDLNHDYDGIHELDNKVPSWWRYAFYATMIFGAVYLYRMFVSETLPDQFRELQAANQMAVIQKEAYLKNAANNIDENNVVQLDATGIAEGASLFSKNCQACHGDKGQGGVGPNLTDDYWLHNGSLPDIFKSIKYGWQEKGMKAWKDDFSPVQIAQLASYIKSLHGTNPPAAKEPQGTLYTGTGTINKIQDTTTTTHL